MQNLMLKVSVSPKSYVIGLWAPQTYGFSALAWVSTIALHYVKMAPRELFTHDTGSVKAAESGSSNATQLI